MGLDLARSNGPGNFFELILLAVLNVDLQPTDELFTIRLGDAFGVAHEVRRLGGLEERAGVFGPLPAKLGEGVDPQAFPLQLLPLGGADNPGAGATVQRGLVLLHLPPVRVVL